MPELKLRTSTKRHFERLELRQVLSASTATVSPNLIVLPDASTSSTPSGLSPAQVKTAYGFNNIMFGSVVGDGNKQTIAIVDAYNDPNIVADLAKFDTQYGIAAPVSLKIVGQTGGTKLPKNDRGWSSEIALDVEWAHAMAPGANILLVEASSANDSDLNAALDYARSAPGVVVVSNSWGGSEYNTEKSDDVHFTTPSGHAGVTFTVAAGDDGAPAEYPSSSPDVLSVGGSSLRLTSTGAYSSETVWNGGGGGASRYEGLPSYQAGLGITNRGTPDVSYDANPNTGFAVYDSYGDTGWDVYGGTSAGAPQWAALIAIADQGRALAGKGSLANAQAALYTLSRSDFHDITSGSNGGSATSGYDLASGLGSPIASSVIRDLVAFGGSTSFTQAAATTPAPTRHGGFGWWGFFFGFEESAGGSAAAAGGMAGSAASTSGMTANISDASGDAGLASPSVVLESAIGMNSGDGSALSQLSTTSGDSAKSAAADVSALPNHFLHTLHHQHLDAGAIDAFFANFEAA
ncbi:MAG TPA: S53 family peptidase [Pirellulales bacterium]|jgi:subtilase family serine protease